MAQAQDLRQAITSVADRQGPVLSAYLSVNADIPENQGKTYLVRLSDAMNDEGVPKDLQQRIRDYLEEAHPAARTLAIFVDEDDLFEVYRLQVDVPESFRWGTLSWHPWRSRWTSTSRMGPRSSTPRGSGTSWSRP